MSVLSQVILVTLFIFNIRNTLNTKEIFTKRRYSKRTKTVHPLKRTTKMNNFHGKGICVPERTISTRKEYLREHLHLKEYIYKIWY